MLKLVILNLLTWQHCSSLVTDKFFFCLITNFSVDTALITFPLLNSFRSLDSVKIPQTVLFENHFVLFMLLRFV